MDPQPVPQGPQPQQNPSTYPGGFEYPCQSLIQMRALLGLEMMFGGRQVEGMIRMNSGSGIIQNIYTRCLKAE
jgi:hypothetical protein